MKKLVKKVYYFIVPKGCRRFIKNPYEQIVILFYRYLNISKMGVNLNDQREKKIIVSFTSYPARLHNIHLTIKSLMLQTVKPDMIILYLGEDTKEEIIPKRVLDLQSLGLTIQKMPGDLGSFKKFYYAFKDFPNDYVITVDDDLIYDRKMIEVLYKSAKENDHCIIAKRAHLMIKNDKELASYSKWIYECDNIHIPSMALFATTGAGTLFRPNLFSKGWDDIDTFMNYCKNTDDIWIKFMAIKSGIPVLFVKSNRIMPIEIDKEDLNALKCSNFYINNDLNIHKLCDIFNINLYNYAMTIEQYNSFRELSYEESANV